MDQIHITVLWINFRGWISYHEIHEIQYTMKISMRTVAISLYASDKYSGIVLSPYMVMH